VSGENDGGSGSETDGKPTASLGRTTAALRRLFQNDQLSLLILSVLIGVAAAYCAIGFRELYLLGQLTSFGIRSDTLVSHAARLPGWQIVLVPTAGGLLIGLFVRYVMPDQRAHGVADVMEAVALRSGRVGLREGLGSAVVSAASISVGASVGREGPVVHLGATLASAIAHRLGLSRSQAVTLLGCGVAAAVSSSFNAPIAGVFFALEVVIGHYALSAFAPIVLASVSGAIVSRLHFGDFPAFIVPDRVITSFFELPAFALLGVASAALAFAFLKSIALVKDTANRLEVPVWARPAIAGCLVGLIALQFPEVLGVGYGPTDASLKELMPLHLLILLVISKTAATAICLGSGFGGGVFSPSLFMGAMLGGAFGIVATQAFPDYSTGHGAYALVGMGAVAGSVLGAPISTILIVFELTGDYSVTVAVMIAVVISSVITQQTQVRSFFRWQLDDRGIDLNGGPEIRLMGDIRAADIMSTDYAAVLASAGMREVREKLLTAPHAELFVVDGDGNLNGTIMLSDLSEDALEGTLDGILNASDVARHHPPAATADSGIDQSLRLMRESGEEHIAVVEARENMRLVGFLHQVDVMRAYNRALIAARREERGET
jgi:CIC family chloride channel protein